MWGREASLGACDSIVVHKELNQALGLHAKPVAQLSEPRYPVDPLHPQCQGLQHVPFRATRMELMPNRRACRVCKLAAKDL